MKSHSNISKTKPLKELVKEHISSNDGNTKLLKKVVKDLVNKNELRKAGYNGQDIH